MPECCPRVPPESLLPALVRPGRLCPWPQHRPRLPTLLLISSCHPPAARSTVSLRHTRVCTYRWHLIAWASRPVPARPRTPATTPLRSPRACPAARPPTRARPQPTSRRSQPPASDALHPNVSHRYDRAPAARPGHHSQTWSRCLLNWPAVSPRTGVACELLPPPPLLPPSLSLHFQHLTQCLSPARCLGNIY